MSIAVAFFSVFMQWFALPAEIPSTPPAFAVIVSSDVGAAHLTRDDAALIYRRRQTFWANGHRVQAVNLPASHPLRRAFSQCVLGQSPDAMEEYWREMYFHGVLPPRVLESEQAVSLFVASTPGGIGYVSSCTNDPRVVVLLTFGEVPNCPKRVATCAPLQDS